MHVQIHRNVYFTTFQCLPVLKYNAYKVCGNPAELLYHFWCLGNKCSMKCQNYDVKSDIQSIFYNVYFITNFSSLNILKKKS